MCVIQSATNRGFAGGSNLGIEAALSSGTDAVLLLNNDGSIDASCDAGFGSRHRCGGADGLAPREVCLRRRPEHRATRGHASQAARAPQPSWTWTTCRARSHSSSGSYWKASVFWTRTTSLAARWPICVTGLGCVDSGRVTDPRGRALHDLDRSAHDRQTLHIYYAVRNRFLFVRKHYARRRTCLYARWIVRASLTILAALCRSKRRRARAVMLGMLDGVRGCFGGQNERVLA